MALNKQKVSLNFSNGIDTKTDEKLVVPSKLLVLENGVFKKTGRISKRNGYDVLSQENKTTSNTIDSGYALANLNEELLLFSENRLYSYADSVLGWVDKGTIKSVKLETKDVIKNAYSQTNPSSHINENTQVFAWEDSRGGVRASVIDLVTGNNIVNDVEVSPTGEAPKVLTIGGDIAILYRKGNDFCFRLLSKVTPTLLQPETTMFSGIKVGSSYDAVVTGGRIYAIYITTADDAEVRYWDQATQTVSASFSIGNGVFNVSISTDKDENLYTVINDGDIKTTTYLYNMNLLRAELLITAPMVTIDNLSSVVDDNGDILIHWEANDVETYNHLVSGVRVDSNGVIGPIQQIRSVGLGGKAFVVNNEVFIPVIHESILQTTLFILAEDMTVIAKITPNNVGKLITSNVLSEVELLNDSNTVLLPYSIKKPIESENSTIFSLTGVAAAYIDFTSNNRHQSVIMGGLHIAGASNSFYDGVSVVEEGFHLFPENVSAVKAAGGSLSAGSYQYSVCYEWTDNYGQNHRSAPSVPVKITTVASDKVTLTIPTLRITGRIGSRGDVRIVIYRTEANGSVFRRITSISTPLFNDASVDRVFYEDKAADSTILANEVLYTTGGVIENIAPGAATLITTYGDRIMLAGLEDPLTFAYSKVRSTGYPVEFSDFFMGRVDPRGGDITAIAAMDSYFIIFKRNSIFVMTGDGPNDLGSGGFSQPTLITTDAGCDNPNTVVITPDGLMFKSSKGIYLLTRKLSVEYIGAEVEDYNSLTITSSDLMSDVNEVRYTTKEDLCLVYNYYYRQWSTFTNHSAEDCTVWNNKFVFLRSTGEVWVQNPESWTDNGEPIVLSLVTAWISLGDVQGYERIYRAYFLGEYKSPHKLQVDIGYNYNPYFIQSGTIDITDTYVLNTYGSQTYGDDVYGGEFPLYQFNNHLTIQKCNTVRFRITDIQNYLGSDYGEGFNIVNMTLEIGVKAGLNKMSTKNRFKTS